MEEDRKKKLEESDENKDSDSVWSLSFENFANGIHILMQSDLTHLRESAKEAINSVFAGVGGVRVFDTKEYCIGENVYVSNAKEVEKETNDKPESNEKGGTKETANINAVVDETSTTDRNSPSGPVKTGPFSEEQVLETEARDSDAQSNWNPRSWWRR